MQNDFTFTKPFFLYFPSKNQFVDLCIQSYMIISGFLCLEFLRFGGELIRQVVRRVAVVRNWGSQSVSQRVLGRSCCCLQITLCCPPTSPWLLKVAHVHVLRTSPLSFSRCSLPPALQIMARVQNVTNNRESKTPFVSDLSWFDHRGFGWYIMKDVAKRG